MISIYEPNITDYSKSAIDAVKSGWISNHGEYIKKATDKLNSYLNAKYSILMANGTCTTHCLFISLKYKYPEIKKIYVPNNCYVAAWNCVLMEYEKENIEVLKMNIDTWNIETSVDYFNTLDKNCAVLIVHNLGNIVNVPRLKKIRPDIIFIEDNCEGLFGKYDDLFTGTSDCSLCASVSFYGNKIITTGEGGAFFTNDKEIYDYISKVYSQGMSSTRYLHDVHAYNYRITNVKAGFLYDQLNDIENILSNKRRIFENYEKLLEILIIENKVKLFKKEENTKNADWIFSLRIVNNSFSIDETFNFFKENNIDIRPFFYPINSHEHLSDIKTDDNVSIILNKEVLMIPSSPKITYLEQEIVINTIEKFIFLLDNKFKIVEVTEINKNLLKDFIPNIKSTSFRYFQKRNEDIIKNHILTVLLINSENIVFGYAHIDYDDDKYWFGIYLDSEYQSRGIGNKLMGYVLNHYKLINIDEIYLTVDNDNINAIKLYKKYQFEEIFKNEKYTMMRNIL